MTDTHLVHGWRFRLLLLSAVISAISYIGFALWGGWQEVWQAFTRIGATATSAAFILSLINYGLRFIRWNGYLVELGCSSLPSAEHLRIYLAGFALTATPGKAGEALRTVLLKPLGVPYSNSFAALVSERLADIAVVLLLSLLGIAAYPELFPIALVFLAAMGGFVAILMPAPQRWVRSGLSRRNSQFSQLMMKVVNVFAQARRCNPPGMIVKGLILGGLAWAAEGLGFWFLLEQVDANISWYLAISIYCLSMLAGAASFMPGGIGGAEAAMTAMLTLSGVPLPIAIAVTVLIRLATLWFAVVIGLFLLIPYLAKTKNGK